MPGFSTNFKRKNESKAPKSTENELTEKHVCNRLCQTALFNKVVFLRKNKWSRPNLFELYVVL